MPLNPLKISKRKLENIADSVSHFKFSIFIIMDHKSLHSMKYAIFQPNVIVLGVSILISYLSLLSCTSKVEKDEKLSQSYSNIEKQYFLEIFFDEGRTAKWNTNNISFSTYGQFSKNDIIFLTNTLNYIANLKGLPRFTHVPNDGKLKFIMNTTDEGFMSNGDKLSGFTANKLDFFNREIKSTEIHFKPSLTETQIHITLQHELLHGLGLSGHPKSIFPFSSALGIRYFDTMEPKISSEIPEIDSKALMLLYNRKLPTAVTKKDLSSFLNVN